MKIKTYHIRFGLMLLAFILAFAEPSWATGRTEEMPWEEPIEKAVNSLSGNTAKFLAIAAIVATGLALAFSEGGGGMRRAVWVAFGISVTFAASRFFIGFFNFTTATGIPF